MFTELSEDLFHDGCIVCEIRDCRSEGGGGAVEGGKARSEGGGGAVEGGKARFVLLRPSTQSIICDSLRQGSAIVFRLLYHDLTFTLKAS